MLLLELDCYLLLLYLELKLLGEFLVVLQFLFAALLFRGARCMGAFTFQVFVRRDTTHICMRTVCLLRLFTTRALGGQPRAHILPEQGVRVASF